jgi:tetratricopeptide (TPR) repeat protein
VTRRQDRWNRWADVFNSATRNLARLANGQIAGGVKFFVDLLFSRRMFTKVTDRQRKEWFLIDTHLRGDAEGVEAKQLGRRMAELEEQFRKDAVRRAMRVARYYADRGWWHEAYFYVQAAEEAGYAGQKRFRRRVRQAVADEMRGIKRSLMVADTERFLRTPAQLRAYTELLEALALGDPLRLRDAVTTAGRTLGGTPLADEVEDALSVLFEWTGDRPRAIEIQRDLALRYAETQTGRAALARLDDPQYNPPARFEQEKAEYRQRQVRYVAFGEETGRRQLELLSELAVPSMPTLGAVGAFLVTDVLVRSVIVSVANPVSPADMLEAGEQVLADPRSPLTTEEKSEMRVELGVLYRRLRRHEDAAAAYRQAGVLSPELRRELDEEAADELFRRIREQETVANQVLLLERLIAKYPETPTAARARDHLGMLRTESKIDFAIPHSWLAEDPGHWVGLGAAVPRKLIDGRRRNGELNERGLVFWRDVWTSATFVCADGETTGYVNLTPQRKEVLRAAAEMWVDEKMALEEGEYALAASRLPFEIRGSAGSAGLLVFPTLRHVPLTEEEKRLFK